MSILMSIKPEWCKKIIYGDKTIEVRKTKPELITTPFTVYVYATFGGENWAVYGKQKSGFVIGAFTCERVVRYDIPYPAYQKDMDQELKEKSGLTYMQLHRYADQQGYVYGWHIREFENWDTPLDISEFINSKGNIFKHPPQSWAYAVRRCGMTEWICKEKQMIRQGDGATIGVCLAREKELVRCKDCNKRGQSVYRTDGAEYIVCWNQGLGIQHPIDWFCADGDRR